jgi:hypothetical protein
MAFRMFMLPHRGHLMAIREYSASASFRLHFPHRLLFIQVVSGVALTRCVRTVRCLGQTQALPCGRWPSGVFPHSGRSRRLNQAQVSVPGPAESIQTF